MNELNNKMESQVSKEITGAGRNVEVLIKTVKELRTRLQPLLRPANKGEAPTETARNILVPIAENINALGNGINSARFELEEILSLLEI